MMRMRGISLIRRRGFTLVEALSVIAIIGILASLTIYVVTSAQRQARDAVRKSDVSSIAQGFEARFLDKTCTDQSAVGIYPGEAIMLADIGGAAGRMLWHRVSELYSTTDRCRNFSYYLPTLPNDPNNPDAPYIFNLSSKDEFAAKHYRLAALLERGPSTSQLEEICRLSDVWYSTYEGEKYINCGGQLASQTSAADGIATWFKELVGSAVPKVLATTAICFAPEIPDPSNPEQCINPDTNPNNNNNNNNNGNTVPCVEEGTETEAPTPETNTTSPSSFIDKFWGMLAMKAFALTVTDPEGTPGDDPDPDPDPDPNPNPNNCVCPAGYEKDPNDPTKCVPTNGGNNEEPEEAIYNYYIGR